MKLRLLLVVFVVPVQLMGQQPPLPERLMIGPEEYVKAPDPFSIRLVESATRLDSVRARNLAPRNWGITHLRPCRPVDVVDTEGWELTDGLPLPPGFARDSSYRSYHGGMKWQSDQLALFLVNGWWGVDYDSAGYLISCHVETRSGPYIVTEKRTASGFEFHAFPLDPAWRPSSAISGEAPTEEGLRILWTTLMLMSPPHCRYMTGGPVFDPQAPPC